jgi:hypothetical protein
MPLNTLSAALIVFIVSASPLLAARLAVPEPSGQDPAPAETQQANPGELRLSPRPGDRLEAPGLGREMPLPAPGEAKPRPAERGSQGQPKP